MYYQGAWSRGERDSGYEGYAPPAGGGGDDGGSGGEAPTFGRAVSAAVQAVDDVIASFGVKTMVGASSKI